MGEDSSVHESLLFPTESKLKEPKSSSSSESLLCPSGSNLSSSDGSTFSSSEYPQPTSAATASFRRSRTDPSLPSLSSVLGANAVEGDPSAPVVVPRTTFFLFLYLAVGVSIYVVGRKHFSSDDDTHPVVDALYFSIVTMCTIGYGDITPTSPSTKLFSAAFVLVGFGFVGILLGSALSNFLRSQERLVLSALKGEPDSYLVDAKKGRVRIRTKVGLALAAVVMCVGVGACVSHFVEGLEWLDAIYLAVMSVTTVGYGDHSFKTTSGRLFASVWLLISTFAVARAFLFLAEARVDRRQKKMAKRVLDRGMGVEEFLAADINDNGVVSKSEYVIHKLKEMGKISEKDIAPICQQFRKIDVGNCGKIRLSHLLSNHPPR